MNHDIIAQRRARLEATLRAKYTGDKIHVLAEAAAKRGARRARRNKIVGVSMMSVLCLGVATHRVLDAAQPTTLDRFAAQTSHTVRTVMETIPFPAAVPYQVEDIGPGEPQWSPSQTREGGPIAIRVAAGEMRINANEHLRVDLTPPPGAPFAEAAVVGDHSVFVVMYRQASVLVESERGALKVLVDGEVHHLSPGGRLVLGEAASKTVAGVDVRSSKVSRRADWKKLAQLGELEAARVALRETRLREPQDLMLAADILRRAGHPAEAEPYLRRILDDHPKNATAPVAAFALGKLYLNSLNKPARAAQMFGRVRTLGGGALAEDALAREVESWAQAGRRGEARSLARAYLEQHPQGRHVGTMRRYAGSK